MGKASRWGGVSRWHCFHHRVLLLCMGGSEGPGHADDGDWESLRLIPVRPLMFLRLRPFVAAAGRDILLHLWDVSSLGRQANQWQQLTLPHRVSEINSWLFCETSICFISSSLRKLGAFLQGLWWTRRLQSLLSLMRKQQQQQLTPLLSDRGQSSGCFIRYALT